MKVNGVIFCFIIMFVFNGCSADSAADNNDWLSGAWNLINLSGGFAGINNDFEKGRIVWKFNPKDETLIVANNDDSTSIYKGLATGIYTYAILKDKDQSYLELNDKEYGGIIDSRSQLVIDQNSTTSGSGADGFVMVLARQ
jgi:hypothetical protein